MSANSDTITGLLGAWRRCEDGSEAKLFEQVEPVLRRLAWRQLSEGAGAPSLRVTELVNEGYLRLVPQRDVDWQSRGHFYSIAARVMRRIVVDEVRRRRAGKRGAGMALLSLDTIPEPPDPGPSRRPDLIDVHEALDALARTDPWAASCVELRFFAGLTLDEIAAVKSVSRATVVRRWRFARAWLRSALSSVPSDGSAGSPTLLGTAR